MFKKMGKTFSIVLAIALLASMCCIAALTVSAADGDTYNVAGEAGLCGDAWTPSVNQMTDKGDGTWEITFTGVNVPEAAAAANKDLPDEFVGLFGYQFKIVTNGAWDVGEYNLTGDASKGGQNAFVEITEDDSTVVIGFDGEKAVVVSVTGGGTPVDTTTEPEPTEPPVGTYVQVGQKAKFTVNLKTALNEDGSVRKLAGVEASVFYPSDMLQITSVEYPIVDGGDVLDNLTSEIDPATAEGDYRYNFTSASKSYDFSEGGTIVIVYFDVIADGYVEVESMIRECYDSTVEMNDFIIDNEPVSDDDATEGIFEVIVEIPTTEPPETTTDPDETDPDATDPDATDPDATDPDATDPDATDPDDTTTTAAPTETTTEDPGTVTTGDTTAVTVLFVVLMMAAGVVLFARKRVSE